LKAKGYDPSRAKGFISLPSVISNINVNTSIEVVRCSNVGFGVGKNNKEAFITLLGEEFYTSLRENPFNTEIIQKIIESGASDLVYNICKYAFRGKVFTYLLCEGLIEEDKTAVSIKRLPNEGSNKVFQMTAL
jgi:hypothetical protein